jgi:hypothetical protein
LVGVIDRVFRAWLDAGCARFLKPFPRQAHCGFMLPAARPARVNPVGHLGSIIGRRQAP